MDILADENFDAPLVAWLRGQGHVVLWMPEYAPGVEDTDILQLARAQQRVVITFDRDFGDLIFRQGVRPPGVILLRFRIRCASELLSAFQEAWPTVEPRAPGHFTVVSHGNVRIRPL